MRQIKKGLHLVNLEQSSGSQPLESRIYQGFDDKCLMCMVGIPETIVHRFWDCKIAQRTWDFSIGIINTIIAKLGEVGPWRPLDWQHKIFGKKVPTFLNVMSRV